MTNVQKTFVLGQNVILYQPVHGYKSGIDPIFLAFFADVRETDHVLDFGCGVGASMFALKFFYPQVKIHGIDIQESLIDLALKNKEENRWDDVSCTCECFSHISQTVDAVIMNPPYFADLECMHPQNEILKTANVEGKLKLKDWVFHAHRCLKNKGRLSIIHRAEALEEILSLLFKHHFGGICLFPLWPKEGKLAKRIVITAVKNSKKPTQIFPGIILHTQDNHYTAQAEEILKGKRSGFWKKSHDGK
jgi:tRNA1(Val) A37 N6-methylase TrmN6